MLKREPIRSVVRIKGDPDCDDTSKSRNKAAGCWVVEGNVSHPLTKKSEEDSARFSFQKESELIKHRMRKSDSQEKGTDCSVVTIKKEVISSSDDDMTSEGSGIDSDAHISEANNASNEGKNDPCVNIKENSSSESDDTEDWSPGCADDIKEEAVVDNDDDLTEEGPSQSSRYVKHEECRYNTSDEDSHLSSATGSSDDVTGNERFMDTGDIHGYSLIRGMKKQHECSTCGKIFSRPGILNAHMRIHTGERPHICTTCGKSFTRPEHLKRHAIIHTGEKPHVCNACGKSFRRLGHLKRHAQVHTGERPHHCVMCGKNFTTAADLKVHVRIHTGERPYTCSTCGKKFITTGKLKVHTTVHTGERQHSCSVCSKKFIYAGHLAAHMKIHTREKSYMCSTCGEAFRTAGALRVHMSVHPEKRPHACSTCGMSFKRAGHLKRHAVMHKKKNGNSCNNPEVLTEQPRMRTGRDGPRFVQTDRQVLDALDAGAEDCAAMVGGNV